MTGPSAAVLAAHERRGDALAVAAVAQLAEELVDEVAAVGEDQRAAGARALDEAERGDRLAGARRVLEPEALGGVGILRRLGELLLLGGVARAVVVPVLRLLRLVLVVELLLAGDAGRRERGRLLRDGAVGGRAVARLGEQRGQRAGERVDLVRGEDGAVDELGLVLGEQAVEPEQERPALAPRHRRDLRAGLELGQRRVERAAAGGAGRRAGPRGSPPRARTAHG